MHLPPWKYHLRLMFAAHHNQVLGGMVPMKAGAWSCLQASEHEAAANTHIARVELVNSSPSRRY